MFFNMKQLSIFSSPLEPKSYHATTSIPVQEQIEKEKKCKKQEDVFLEIYKKHSILSPSQAHKIYCSQNKEIPITSSRRAISNLKKSGYLTRTEVLVKGLFDTEHCYKIN